MLPLQMDWSVIVARVADGTLVPPRWLPRWVARANGLAGMLAFSLFANRIHLDQIADRFDLALALQPAAKQVIRLMRKRPTPLNPHF